MKGVTRLETFVRPFLVCMTLLGFNFSTKNGYAVSPEVVKENNLSRKLKMLKIVDSKLYCLTINVIMIVNFLRYIPSFWIGLEFAPGLNVIRVITTSWFLQCATNGFLMFIACRINHLQTFFDFYDKICSDEIAEQLNLKENFIKIRRITNILAAIAISFICIDQVLIIVVLFSDIFLDVSIAMTSPLSQHVVTKIFIAMICIFCNGAWILPVCFFIVLFSSVRYQLRTVSEYLKEQIQANKDNIFDTLHYIRIKHTQLSKAIIILDQYTSKLLLAIYVNGICISCFLLYQLVNDNSLGTFSIVLYSGWLLCNITIVTSSSIAAALVSVEAHAALECIYDIDESKGSPTQVTTLNLFLSKLNGPAIGFTAMGIVTVTKGFLLTLAGIFVTYFFLLLQFQV